MKARESRRPRAAAPEGDEGRLLPAFFSSRRTRGVRTDILDKRNVGYANAGDKNRFAKRGGT